MWSTALERSEALSREADLFHLAWEAAQTEPAIPVPLVGRHWYVYDTVTGSMVCECGNALPANDEKLSAVVHSTSSMEASALGPVFCKRLESAGLLFVVTLANLSHLYIVPGSLPGQSYDSHRPSATYQAGTVV
jgi:hypothetical protein